MSSGRQERELELRVPGKTRTGCVGRYGGAVVIDSDQEIAAVKERDDRIEAALAPPPGPWRSLRRHMSMSWR